MFLTPPSPSRTKLLYTHQQHHSKSNDPPLPTTRNHLPPLLPSSTSTSNPPVMATSHRGLDAGGLPSGMILPDPSRQPPPPPPLTHESHQRQLQQPPPSHHQQSYQQSIARPPHSHDSNRNLQPPPPRRPLQYEREDLTSQQQWQPQARTDQGRLEEYRTKQEEDKTRQEELKLRQEELRLDQRRIEQDMLRESIAKGVHPNLVPLIFIGLGSAASGSSGGFELAQQYIAQFQSVDAQVQSQFHNPASPDVKRDFRPSPAMPLQYGAIQQAAHLTNTPISLTGSGQSPGVAAAVYPSPAYQSPQGHARSGAPQSSRFAATKPQLTSSLPRLTTNDAQEQPVAPLASSVAHSQIQQPQGLHTQPNQAAGGHAYDRASASPSGISFLHWVPPPASGKDSVKTSPQSRRLSGNDTPRKRKATGAHQPAPPPTSTPYNPASPSFSIASTSSRPRTRRRSSMVSVDKTVSSRAQTPMARGVVSQPPLSQAMTAASTLPKNLP